jgi:hypothetical protein
LTDERDKFAARDHETDIAEDFEGRFPLTISARDLIETQDGRVTHT